MDFSTAKNLVHLVPYQVYFLNTSAPSWPFLLPIANFVVAIVITYFRSPAGVTARLFCRYVLLHLLVNTGKLLFLHTRFGTQIAFCLLFLFLDQFAAYDIACPDHSHLPTTSNRCELLNLVAWGVFQMGALCNIPFWLPSIISFVFGKYHLPVRFQDVDGKIFVLGTICIGFALFFKLEIQDCISKLNELPFDTSRFYIDVVNTALIDAGWNYPVHAFIELHVKYMNMMWTFLGLAA